MAEMWINMGPQHPMTHGLWNMRIKVDGETIVDSEPVIGYLHRGWERWSTTAIHPDHPHGRPALLWFLLRVEPRVLHGRGEAHGHRGAG